MISCFNHIKRTSNNVRPGAPPLYTDTAWCGDRSGSMSSMGPSPQEGARGFLEEHKKMAIDLNCKYGYFLELTTFDDKALTYYDDDAKNIKDKDLAIAESSMVPRGMTRFYDTAIECVKRQQERIDAVYDSFPKKVQQLMKDQKLISCVFVTFTDGLDNSSKAGKSELNQCIENHRKSYNATCLFLAANQNADSVGRRLGFGKAECLQMGSDRTSAKMALKSATSASLRTVTGECASFTQLERAVSSTPMESLRYSNLPSGAAALAMHHPPPGEEWDQSPPVSNLFPAQPPIPKRQGHMHPRFQQLRTQHQNYQVQ